MIILYLVLPLVTASRLQERFQWRVLDFAYPTPSAKIDALLTKQFVPENNLPVGIEVWQDKLFVSVPRWREGVPSTLNYISLYNPSKSPPLIPYPSWEWTRRDTCGSSLTNVYRIKADQCNRLWVLDTGTFGIAETTTNPCPYTLKIFDLNTDTLIRSYQLRKEDIVAATFIANIAVDLNTCDDTFAYMSDELGYGLVVYSWRENRSWRFSHGFFMPDPLAGDFFVGGLNFQWSEEGIFGMALSPLLTDGFKWLYFGPLASNWEFAVSTKTLRNEARVNGSYHDFFVLSNRGPQARITARVMDEHGLEFFNLIDRNAVGCWNSKKPYDVGSLAIVDQDDEKLVFPSDVKLDERGNVWVISDKMPVFLMSTLDYSDVNFRIFAAPRHELIRGSVCE